MLESAEEAHDVPHDPRPGFLQQVRFGLVARGPVAIGIVAIGGVAVGVVAIGGVALGLVAVGALAAGGIAVGALALGMKQVSAFALLAGAALPFFRRPGRSARRRDR